MIAVFTFLVVTAATLYYIKWRSERKRLYELAEKIPGPELLPLASKAFSILKNHNTLLKYIYDLSFIPEYQNVAKLWLGSRLVVGLVHPKDVEIILSSNVHLKKSQEYKLFEPWFGNGLLISSGETWRHQRKMIAPTFHLNILKRFMDEFNRNSQRVIERMRKENGKMFDCHDYMSEIMVETLIETVMGVKQESQNRECFSYAHSVMDLCDILHTRHTRPWYRPEYLFKLTNMSKEWDRNLQNIFNLTNRVFNTKKEDCIKNKSKESTMTKEDVKEETKVETKIETHSDEKFSYGQAAGLKDDLDDDNEIGEKKRLPFLESLIDRSQNGDKLTDQDIIDQVNTIMFEGHDTTAAGSSFFLCVMGDRQDIQAKCIEEIDSIFGDSDRPVTFQDTIEMKYLERCIMETLRLFPPVPLIARELEQDVQLMSENILLPKGCAVVIGTFKLHRRADIYVDPDNFDPDRFLPENAVNRHYYSFVPFSAGPRSCVGRKYAMLKLKILLANILRNFRVKQGKPMKDWQLQADIILKRSDKFEITLEPRRVQKVC
ncbi:unnamed protein product [Nezara viridula]|uniref:Cytochrome P450 n=1 Tax=Nezara viridula TaxID=85310 RepID=A0A9P0DXU7_NEZVI|nr:unnamed protein product [Nezara viridula]